MSHNLPPLPQFTTWRRKYAALVSEEDPNKLPKHEFRSVGACSRSNCSTGKRPKSNDLTKLESRYREAFWIDCNLN